MAFNNWPYTNFQDLNLNWILNRLGIVEATATQSAESVEQYDARITANAEAIEQLGIDLETISDVAKVFVNNNLEAYYRGNHITGSELFDMLGSHGTLPFVQYNGEIYMLDTVSNAGDMRFSMGHTVDVFSELVVRHIMIPAQSYNAAYSITNVSAGGGSSNVVVFHISDSTCDHTYSELLSAWNSGKTLVANIGQVGNVQSTSALIYKETVTQSGGTQIDRITIIDPYLSATNGLSVNARFIYSNGTVSYGYLYSNIMTLDGVIATVNDGVTTNALVTTAQTLSASQKTQVKTNIGIVDLPTVASADNGKFLRVVNGAWAADTVPSAESTSFGP